MLYINTRTNTAFSAYTVQDRAGYAAVVTRRQGNHSVLESRIVYPTRSQAYYQANKEARYRAKCHSNVFGM